MTALTGVLSSVLFSPLLFAACLLAGAALALAGRRRAAAWLVGATTLVLLVFSTDIGASLLLGPLERQYPPLPASAAFDTVVVLGGGVRNGDVVPVSLQRLVAGASLARERGVPIIVSGGITWASGPNESEAVVAARTLTRLGFPADRIIQEPLSTTTWENARRTAEVMTARGLHRAAVVTTAWHMPRAMLSFQRAGVDAVAVPAGRLTGEPVTALSFLPAFETLADSFRALHEYLGMAAYAMRK
jgi:uncharacterized SAM-binding protein YcdF (DUF218 family)